MLKILHSGDLHLDAAFASLDERQAQIRKNEMRAAFTSMMTYARMNGIDVVLMAGDVFDSQYVTRETATLLAKEFEKFAGPVFISPGNHDCADSGSVWRQIRFPENVYVFTETELTCVELPEKNTVVWGYGFTSPSLETSPIRGKAVTDPAKTNLLVCHCDTVDQKGPYAPVREEDILAFGADYTAMGHIHNPPPAGEKWAYCGCLEPRDFSETGLKGACVVEIDKEGVHSTVRMKRVRFSKRRYENGSLDVSGCASMQEVAERTESYVRDHKYGEDVLLALEYTGTVEEGLVINPDLLDTYGLFFLKTEDRTLPAPDLDALAGDTGIRGAFYRVLAPALQSEDLAEREKALRALRYGLAAIAGENIVG